MKESIFILGIGRNTPLYIELALDCGYEVKGLYHFNDSLTGSFIHDIPVLGSTDELFSRSTLENLNFALSMGDNHIRANLFDEIKKKNGVIPKLIHPKATCSIFSTIGEGSIVQANAVVQANTKVGRNSVVLFNCSIAHNTIIGDSCFIATGTTVGAYITIEDLAIIGQSSTLVSGKLSTIGRNSVIGAGSVVLTDVEANTIVAGNPAKLLKK